MTQFSRLTRLSASLVLLASMLSACGGGGGRPGTTSGTAGQPPAAAPLPPPPLVEPTVITATPDTAAIGSDKTIVLTVTANDSATNGRTPVLASVTPPAHGSAVVQGDTIVYTPSPTYVGEVKFTYTVNANEGPATAVGQVTLNITRPVVLSGTVTMVPGVASSVTVAVGPRSYSTTTTTTGAYSIPVMLASSSELIVVTAQASAPYAHIKYISLAGEGSGPLNSIALGAPLTAAQLPGLNVNNVTTAHYALVKKMNGNALPATPAALAQASVRIPAAEMFQMASVIRMTALPTNLAPARALPSGIADTLALVSDTTAYTALTKSLLHGARAEVVNAQRLTNEELAGVTIAGPASGTPYTLILSAGEGAHAPRPVVQIEVAASGASAVSMGGQTMWASRLPGAMVFALPRPITTYISHNGDTVRMMVDQIRVTQFTGDAGTGTARVAYNGTLYDLHSDVPLGQKQELQNFRFHQWEAITPLTTADVSGQVLVGLKDRERDDMALDSQLSMAFKEDGTMRALEIPTLAGTWTLVNGKLVLHMNDGRVHEMARLHRGTLGNERWVVRAYAGTAHDLYDTLMVTQQAGLAFTEATAANRFLSEQTPVVRDYFYNLMADHTGVEDIVELSGVQRVLRTNSWSIADGVLRLSYYQLPDGTNVTVCPAGVTCRLREEKNWTLLRQDGDVYTVLSNFSYNNRELRGRTLARYRRVAR